MAVEAMTREELDALVRSVDPGARVLPARVLRRIIKTEQNRGLLGLYLAHRLSLTIPASAALRAVSASELGLDAPASADPLLLIAEPEDDLTRTDAQQWAWRRLFHARVHAEFARRPLTGQAIAERIGAIGSGVFSEALGVLDRDGWLIDPRNEAAAYEEFAVVFLELSRFAPDLIPAYFPRIEDPERVASTIRQDIDDEAIFAATRPEGTPAPAPHPIVQDEANASPPPTTDDVPRRSEVQYRWLIARANRARKLGNVARSAILRTRAARLVGPTMAGQARAGAEDDIATLARRLYAAVELREVGGDDLTAALAALVMASDSWFLTVEARLLYDLQNVCVDHEREIYELDLAGWLITLGSRPLKRPLPNQRLIRISKHLRRAALRLPRIRVSDRARGALAALIHGAHESAEERVRERFRPLVARSLDLAGVRPENLPESISFDRMTDELLDRLVEHDHLTMGDVRDAIARSDLREPDVAGWSSLRRGDRVLRANRRFAVSLDGVYRRGEVYLRTLQQASFLTFGTKVGRWITRHIVLPYGGAFGLLFTVQELIETGQKIIAKIRGVPLHHEDVARFTNATTVGVLGTVILIAIQTDRTRAYAWFLLSQLWRALRFVLIDFPAWFLARPIVRAILTSPAFDLVRRVLIQPLVLAAAVATLIHWIDGDWRVAIGIAGAVFAVAALFLGTSVGRDAEELAADAALRSWRRVRADLLPGLIRLIAELFSTILQGVEAVLYAVDEKLRFRSGQGRWTLRAKALAGLFWGAITYVIRIYINLLVEPTINPLKHFPTVTVAAKLIIPVLDQLYHSIARVLSFLGPWPAGAFASLTVIFLPGLAGFIVWELKENWRLFRATRPTDLQPTVIGHHGETMRRLLRPGFHSGTIPKLFAKLRRAERHAYRTGEHAGARKARESIHHIEEAIRHFIERGFVAILVNSGRFAGAELAVSQIAVATNRVLVIVGRQDGCTRFRIQFEDDGEQLIVRAQDEGWCEGLESERNDVVGAAVRGVTARAGADLIEGDPALLTTSLPQVHQIDGSPSSAVVWREWVAYWETQRVPTKPPVEKTPAEAG